jgi:hypothetical protein
VQAEGAPDQDRVHQAVVVVGYEQQRNPLRQAIEAVHLDLPEEDPREAAGEAFDDGIRGPCHGYILRPVIRCTNRTSVVRARG